MSEKLQLWIDDIRPAPEGWFHIKSVNEAKEIFDFLFHTDQLDKIALWDLDHDAGIYNPWGGDYINILCYLEYMYKTFDIPAPRICIHSFNAVGVVNMRAIIKHNNWEEVFI